MVRVLLDGDGAPCKAEILRLYQQYSFEWWIFIDVSHYLDISQATIVYCDKGRDSADFALLKQARANDIVITGDMGLAGLALAKQCQVLDFYGRVVHEDNITAILTERYEGQKWRRQNKHLKTIAKRKAEDDERFYLGLKTLLEERCHGTRAKTITDKN